MQRNLIVAIEILSFYFGFIYEWDQFHFIVSSSLRDKMAVENGVSIFVVPMLGHFNWIIIRYCTSLVNGLFDSNGENVFKRSLKSRTSITIAACFMDFSSFIFRK